VTDDGGYYSVALGTNEEKAIAVADAEMLPWPSEKISLPVGVLTMSSRRDIVQIAYALQPAPAPPAGVARVDVRFVFCSPAQRFTSTCCCSTALRT
jgi:hypothetical protein